MPLRLRIIGPAIAAGLSLLGVGASAQEAAPQTEQKAITAAEPLKSVANPQQTLKTASLRSSDGKDIGKIQSVTLGADGKARQVKVMVTGGTAGTDIKVVAIDVSGASYDPTNKIVIVALSEAQIKSLPSIAPGG